MKFNVCGVDLDHHVWNQNAQHSISLSIFKHLSMPSILLRHLHNHLSPQLTLSNFLHLIIA